MTEHASHVSTNMADSNGCHVSRRSCNGCLHHIIIFFLINEGLSSGDLQHTDSI